MRKISEEIKADPSDVHQNFQDVSIRLFCCRYWILEEWDCNDLKVPFWRIYHNALAGSSVRYHGQVFALDKDVLLVIPPNTSFSAHLKQNSFQTDESIKGRKFTPQDDLSTLQQKGKVDHLFIHFTLGYPLDFINSGIYQIKLSENTLDNVEEIKKACISDTITGPREALRIKQLITGALLQLPEEIWASGNIDHRILKSIRFMESNFNKKITNEQLANRTNMATNSFARLFKSSIGVASQQYILRLKVQAACNLMHHTNKSLDEISFECGFSDRHHFSKIFKKVQKINPSDYKKQQKIL